MSRRAIRITKETAPLDDLLREPIFLGQGLTRRRANPAHSIVYRSYGWRERFTGRVYRLRHMLADAEMCRVMQRAGGFHVRWPRPPGEFQKVIR